MLDAIKVKIVRDVHNACGTVLAIVSLLPAMLLREKIHLPPVPNFTFSYANRQVIKVRSCSKNVMYELPSKSRQTASSAFVSFV